MNCYLWGEILGVMVLKSPVTFCGSENPQLRRTTIEVLKTGSKSCTDSSVYFPGQWLGPSSYEVSLSYLFA